MRRSSRIQSMFRPNYNPEDTFHTEDLMILTDDTSTDQDGEEEEKEDDDLTSAFTAKIDKDWMPVHSEKPVKKATRPVREAAKKVSGGVKIFMPNIGLEASTISSKDKSHKSHVSKQLNVAISSSSSESEN